MYEFNNKNIESKIVFLLNVFPLWIIHGIVLLQITCTIGPHKLTTSRLTSRKFMVWACVSGNRLVPYTNAIISRRLTHWRMWQNFYELKAFWNQSESLLTAILTRTVSYRCSIELVTDTVCNRRNNMTSLSAYALPNVCETLHDIYQYILFWCETYITHCQLRGCTTVDSSQRLAEWELSDFYVVVVVVIIHTLLGDSISILIARALHNKLLRMIHKPLVPKFVV